MPTFHQFNIGELKCTSLSDISGEMDVYSLFDKMPQDELKELLEQVGRSAEWVRQGTVLLIESTTQKILIDTGFPLSFNGSFLENLKAAGVTPDQIDAIFITHADGDHIGGLPLFPDSHIYMPRESYRLWTQETDTMVNDFLGLWTETRTAEQLAEMGKGRRVYPEQVLPSLANRLTVVDPETEFLPGIQFVPAAGHKRDHVAVEISSGGDTLLHIADAFRHPIHCLRPDYYCQFDVDPAMMAESTKMLMARAAEKDAIVFGSHLPFPSLVRIKQVDGNFVWEDV